MAIEKPGCIIDCLFVRDYFYCIGCLCQEELRRDRTTTFCDALDTILDGGLQCGAITEICGAHGSGKTQIW